MSRGGNSAALLPSDSQGGALRPKEGTATEGPKKGQNSGKPFAFLVFNALGDDVQLVTIAAEDEEQAWQQIEATAGNYDQPVFLTPKRHDNLKKLLQTEAENGCMNERVRTTLILRQYKCQDCGARFYLDVEGTKAPLRCQVCSRGSLVHVREIAAELNSLKEVRA